MKYVSFYSSPLGRITLLSDGRILQSLQFSYNKETHSPYKNHSSAKDLYIFDQVKDWLSIYFSGQQPDFTPALDLHGTPFREKIWKLLLAIPYGQRVSYKQIANRLAEQEGLKTMSAQAVGGAVGHNPILLLIPCHRVLGSDGSLTGYVGGLKRKKKLLELESTAS